MLFRLFRAFAMLDSGLPCRSCGGGIGRRDVFGQSEGVCVTCRTA